MQQAGYHGTTQETSRVFKRGQLEFFTFSFFYDKNRTLPVTPQDPQSYPNFRVVSPSGDLLAQGVAVSAGTSGYWKAGWVVPKNAELTNVNKRYKFQTVIVDAELRQFEISFEFEVVETQVHAQEPELQQLVTFVNEPIRIFFKNTVRPEMLRVAVSPRAMDSTILHFATFTYPQPATPTPTDLIEVEEGNYYMYYTDTPPFLQPGEYSARWTVRDFSTSAQDYEHQAITVVTSATMFMVRSLRMFIDKLQKKLGIVFAYTNEDIIEYIVRGLSLVNGYFPPTNYTAENIPSSIETYALMAAAWWGLTSQRTLYAETNLDFSGQTVTLGYNPAADLDSIISSINDKLENQLSKSKKTLVRSSSAAGSVSVRPYRFRTGMVYKVGSGYGQQFINNMMEYGLLD